MKMLLTLFLRRLATVGLAATDTDDTLTEIISLSQYLDFIAHFGVIKFQAKMEMLLSRKGRDSLIHSLSTDVVSKNFSL